MTWISILFFFLTHLPDLIDVIKKVIELIHGLPKMDQLLAKEQLSQAIQTHDLEKVKALTQYWKEQCEGIACPSELKKD